MTQILNLRFATLAFLIVNGIPTHAQQPTPIQRTPMVIAPVEDVLVR